MTDEAAPLDPGPSSAPEAAPAIAAPVETSDALAEWINRLYGAGTSDAKGGLAELIQGRAAPDRRTHQRYSWVPMAWPT